MTITPSLNNPDSNTNNCQRCLNVASEQHITEFMEVFHRNLENGNQQITKVKPITTVAKKFNKLLFTSMEQLEPVRISEKPYLILPKMMFILAMRKPTDSQRNKSKLLLGKKSFSDLRLCNNTIPEKS